MQKKTCPMRKETVRTDIGTREYFLECVGSACAWWTRGECAVAALAEKGRDDS